MLETSFRLPLLICLTSVASCSDTNPSADAGPALEATLENIQQHIFDQTCNMRGCHASGSMAGGLDLGTTEASYAALVNVAVTNSVASESRWLRVKPGEPDLSFLLRKIRGPGLGEGGPMPFDAQITSFYQSLIEDWIAAGAMP